MQAQKPEPRSALFGAVTSQDIERKGEETEKQNKVNQNKSYDYVYHRACNALIRAVLALPWFQLSGPCGMEL